MNKGLLVVVLSMAVIASLTGCSTSSGNGGTVTDAVKLPIPDRQWDPQRPDRTVGWCGEACIQMAIGYFGREETQTRINQAGHPKHPDLYGEDIDTALSNLAVSFIGYDSSGDTSAFIGWIQHQLRSGYPVICGCKIYPDEHPNWSADHFVLVVGFNEKGLWLNTQLDLSGQVLVPYAQLHSHRPGYSFGNRWHSCFGRAITGLH
jgi:hypothetical protein